MNSQKTKSTAHRRMEAIPFYKAILECDSFSSEIKDYASRKLAQSIEIQRQNLERKNNKKNIANILESIKNEAKSASEIAKELNLSTQKVFQLLRVLEKEQKVESWSEKVSRKEPIKVYRLRRNFDSGERDIFGF